MLIASSDQTRAALPFDVLVPALRAAFQADTEVPLRHVHTVQSGDTAGTVLIMPAWGEGYLGIKTVNIFPDNGARGLPGLHATYTLYDATTGVPLAMVDGDQVTARRTAAASALAASYLARADATTLLVLGTGRVASLLVDAYRAVRPIQRVRVWNVRPASAEALAERWRAEGIEAQAVTDLATAVAEADIVSCATLATAPLVQGAWLRPGTHLDLIGSFTPAMREADPACFSGNAVFVDTDEAPRKSGDLLDAMAAGALTLEGIQATLADLTRGRHPGRGDPTEVTVFKAVGSALEDLCAARLVYQQLRAPAA
ncbi:ornithine cyclodeaminase family protein [Achromobacter sp. GG226]|uniref:ornithine cyclodeaminase family protein n=1 Tax=Verticiella alkaliphila TaxID=2779529 RepID=UPI001C0C8C9B|nr:ornithine cyclodeaminase family protein [Verticiella sp. GG226]MBU4611036.1 ornithine cyclodeaminase family protein [Verticiella sp. GG226]